MHNSNPVKENIKVVFFYSRVTLSNADYGQKCNKVLKHFFTDACHPKHFASCILVEHGKMCKMNIQRSQLTLRTIKNLSKDKTLGPEE